MSEEKPARRAWVMQGLTIAALACAFGVYFLGWVPYRAAQLKERKFRQLADLGNQIREAFGTLDTSLSNAATVIQCPEDSASFECRSNQFAANVAQIQPPMELLKSPTISSNQTPSFICSKIDLQQRLNGYAF